MHAKKKVCKTVRINVDTDNVIALGEAIDDTIEFFLEDNPDTILAEIWYALEDVKFKYYNGTDALPSVVPPEECEDEDTEDDNHECRCESCKEKRAHRALTKKHERFTSNYIL